MKNMNVFNTIAYTTAGRRHLSLGKENEDGYAVYEDERINAWAVADGCSESPCAKVASETVLKALMEFAKGEIFEMKAKQIRSSVLNVIDKYLIAAPYEYRLLACTCALIVFNKVSNSYIALSIGDCQAAVITDKLEPKLLLAPVNIFRHREHTVFANSSMASNAMKIEIGTAKTLAGFALITDGAEQLFEASKSNNLIQLSSLCVLSKEQAQTLLESHVHNALSLTTNDDITVLIAMRSDDEQILKIAEATCNTIIEKNDNVNISYKENDDEGINYSEDEKSSEVISEDGSYNSSELLCFLRTPRTVEELSVSGYCFPSECVTFIYPFIREGLVAYNDYHFSTVNGG